MKSTENRRYAVQRLCYDRISSDVFEWSIPEFYLTHLFSGGEILRVLRAIKNAR